MATIVRYTLEPTEQLLVPGLDSGSSGRKGRNGWLRSNALGFGGRGEPLSREGSGSYPVGIERARTESESRWGWWGMVSLNLVPV